MLSGQSEIKPSSGDWGWPGPLQRVPAEMTSMQLAINRPDAVHQEGSPDTPSAGIVPNSGDQ